MGKIKAISFYVYMYFVYLYLLPVTAGKILWMLRIRKKRKKYMTLLRLKTSAMLISRGMPDPLS